MSFRPHIGDYFFILDEEGYTLKINETLFPSPHWGLFFYQIKSL